MGLEARCAVTWQGSTWTAPVHLDSTAIQVRGRPRLVVPLASVRRVEAADGELLLDTPRGALKLEMGADSVAWARRIAAPPSRIKKLGIAPGHRVSLVGFDLPDLKSELTALGAVLVGARGKADAVVFAVNAPAELERLSALRRRIEPDGAVWVVRVKGKAATVREGEVREAARAAGLVDVKVAAFSDTLTADKWVIPVSDRSRPSPAASTRAPGRSRKVRG